MAAKTYQVEIELKTTMNLLTYTEEDAKAEALNIATDICLAAARVGLIMEVRGIKPRQVVSKAEVP